MLFLLALHAHAASTPEEDALAAELNGRAAEAVARLAASDEPENLQAATLLALRLGRFDDAARLLPAPGLPHRGWVDWARVDLLAGQGQTAAAARLALERLDYAMSPAPRTALVARVIDWARERETRDPDGARQLLEAVIRVGGPEVRAAEDALLALPLAETTPLAVRIAATRTGPDASRALGLMLADRDPQRALILLGETIRTGSPASALVAGRAVADLAVPAAARAQVLRGLDRAELPAGAVAGIHFAFGKAVAGRNPEIGLAVLDRLAQDPTLGTDARVAAAELEPNAERRQARWQAIADAVGSSALGIRAQGQVRAALLAQAAREADPRRRAAIAASGATLTGAAADTALLYAAVPPGGGRAEALRTLADRFPGGPWCAELAELEVRAGADQATATRWSRACGPTDGWGRALAARADDDDWLTAIPADGGVDVIVTGVDHFEVAQNRVDPEALYAAGDDNPLAARLDAFLVAPDRTWKVAAQADRVQLVHVPLAGADPLGALTIRVGDTRTTTLAVRHRLDVVGVRVGGDLAVGVLDGARPVPRARLHVQDGDAPPRLVTTGADGLVVVPGLSEDVRVLARAGDGVGMGRFAIAPTIPAEDTGYGVVVGDAGIPVDGARRPVTVFNPGGPARSRTTIVSHGPYGEVERVAVDLVGGVGVVSLWLVGNGRVEVLGAEGEVAATTPVAPAQEAERAVAITTSGEAVTGGTLTVEVWPRVDLPAEGLALTTVVATPWGRTTESHVVTKPGPVRLVVPLHGAAPGDLVQVTATVPGSPVVRVALPVAGTPRAPTPPDADEPPVAIAPSPVPVLSVVHRDHVEKAWFGPRDANRLQGIVPGPNDGWVVSSDADLPTLPLPALPPLQPSLTATANRGDAGTFRLDGLPAGAQTWWWITDGSDYREGPPTLDLPAGWRGPPGDPGEALLREPQDGEAIAAGLLAEEERTREAAALERLDYAFGADAETVAYGASGYGSGGGGFGSKGNSGYGRGGGEVGTPQESGVAPGVDPTLLASGAGPVAGWTASIPPWVSRVWVRVVARAPDGRWTTLTKAVPVGGEALLPWGAPPAPILPATITSREGWVAAALALPLEGRVVALSGLARLGVPGADAAWRAHRLAVVQSTAAALAFGKDGGTPRRGDEAPLPDARRAERARQALLLAGTDAERARAAATRLLEDPTLSDPTRADAGLALWLAGAAPEVIRAALTGGGPLTEVARGLALPADADATARYAAVVWNADADPVFRGAAVVALASVARGAVSAPAASSTTPPALPLSVEPALAAWRGERWSRGTWGEVGDVPWTPPAAVTEVRRGDTVPVRVPIAAHDDWTTLVCPAGRVELPPSALPRVETCEAVIGAGPSTTLRARWIARDGTALGAGSATLAVSPASDAVRPPVSPREQLALGLALSQSGNPAGEPMLERLLREPGLSSGAVARIAGALLDAAVRAGDDARIVETFRRYRELVPDGDLGLGTAAAFAHAVAPRDPARAIAASRVVMDGRFREELAAVGVIREAGLDLTSLKLLRELVADHPETPTVAQARALAPTLLVERADGDGDRLGYTRNSLRHTAAAELARFLVLHPEDPGAPESAVLLVGTLQQLADADRTRRVVGPLSRRYATSAFGWLLGLADAQTQLDDGNGAGALARLSTVPAGAGDAEVSLLRGRALEMMGRREEAEAAYLSSALPEARARYLWVTRRTFPLPPLVADVDSLAGELTPGSRVHLVTTALQLERLLLRDNGVLGASEVRLDGLTAAFDRRVVVAANGDLPLPSLPPGAWLVTAEIEGVVARSILLTDALEVRTDPQEQGTLVEVRTRTGTPVEGAAVWAFDEAGETHARVTDRTGTVWAPGGVVAVLARADGRYGWDTLIPAGTYDEAQAYPAARSMLGSGTNSEGYGTLFDQAVESKVDASAL